VLPELDCKIFFRDMALEIHIQCRARSDTVRVAANVKWVKAQCRAAETM